MATPKLSVVQKVVRGLVRSLGLKRKLSAAFQALALIVSLIPGAGAASAILMAVASWFGVAGILHAGASKNLKAFPLNGVAAFLNALIVVASAVPSWAKYKELLLTIASIISPFAVVATLSKAE